MTLRRFAVILIASILVVVPGRLVFAQTTSQPVTLGAQWESTVSQCRERNLGGWSCVQFPNGAYIYGFVWESTTKRGEPTLWALVAGACEACADMALLRTYQQAPGPVVKTVDLAWPVWIPPGWFVWIAANSTVAAPSLEVHVTLWSTAPAVNVSP
jgi:hypothetical protein